MTSSLTRTGNAEMRNRRRRRPTTLCWRRSNWVGVRTAAADTDDLDVDLRASSLLTNTIYLDPRVTSGATQCSGSGWALNDATTSDGLRRPPPSPTSASGMFPLKTRSTRNRTALWFAAAAPGPPRLSRTALVAVASRTVSAMTALDATSSKSVPQVRENALWMYMSRPSAT